MRYLAGTMTHSLEESRASLQRQIEQIDAPERELYYLRKEFQGKGYATEAYRELMRYAFEEGGVVRISSGCKALNAASERVMRRCGMIKEGEFKECSWFEGNLVDRVSYRLLKREWEAMRA